MSKISKRPIPCPSCGYTGEFTLWESVNVDLNPNMREKVLRGELFRWTCPNCGETFTVPYGTLYHDMKRKFMVYYLPNRPKNGEGLKFRGPNGPYRMDEEYRHRCTYDIHDFQEKIQQLESGLNDCAIEVLKHIALYKRMPEGLPEDTEFRFGGVMPEKGDNRFLIFHCVSPSLDESKIVSLPFSSYEDLANDSMIEKIFEQDADFPEVSQAFLNRILKQ